MIRKIAAHYVFPINSLPIKNGIIYINESGKIIEIKHTKGSFREQAGVEFYSGILVPGFVNTHCHIELSHLKSRISEHTGLPDFLTKISPYRDVEKGIILKAIKKADLEMQKNGIVAVGDISNKNDSFPLKKSSKIHYHTFLEIFAVAPERANSVFEQVRLLKNELAQMELPVSIVPHTPYTLSKDLFQLLKDNDHELGNICSMHNQETKTENDFFINKTGNLFKGLMKMGVDMSHFNASGKNSLESVISFLNSKSKTLLVHNTFSKKEDIELADKYFDKLYWTFCPNANLYIEKTLPNIPLFYEMNQRCTIGTDSLASNHQLSVLEEIKTINRQFSEIPINTLFKWATLNGAEALNIAEKYGSFEVGKNPGINLISQFDFKNMQLLPESKVKVIV